MPIGELPFASVSPPQYRFELGKNSAGVPTFRVGLVEQLDGTLPDELSPDSEKRNVLIEAYRGMRNTFGNVLFFSSPHRTSSFVFRSEREFLQRYDERFAWMVHFYQCALRNGKQYPERYAGLLFVRPWEIHVREALQELRSGSHAHLVPPDADPSQLTPERLYYSLGIPEDHLPSPAICEGYLRPPLSQLRSPFFSQCLDFYAAPYGVTPFSSVPFFASQYGATCGHCCAATSFLISKTRPLLSPYELAVATSGIAAKAHAVADCSQASADGHRFDIKQPLVFPVSKLAISTLQTVAELRCHTQAKVEYFFPPHYSFGQGRAFSQSDEAELSNILCCYLYQGIPVLLLVDPVRLYAEESDDLLLTKEGAEDYTPLERCHLILIHSIARGPQPGSHMFVFSDATDLHLRGSIFHRATVSRLWAARFRPNPAEVPSGMLSPDISPEEYKHNNQCGAVLVVCLPADFSRTYTMVKAEAFAKRRGETRQGAAKPAYKRQIMLRDRSQIRGFLLQRVFEPQYSGRASVPDFTSEERKFREYLRELDIPPLLWVVEEPTDTSYLSGLIADTRAAGQLRGTYDTKTQSIAISGKTKDGIPIDALLSIINGRVVASTRVRNRQVV